MGTRTYLWHGLMLAGLCAAAPGCGHQHMVMNPPIPDASVPRELTMVVLPPYVIAPPDVLRVQVLRPPTVAQALGTPEGAPPPTPPGNPMPPATPEAPMTGGPAGAAGAVQPRPNPFSRAYDPQPIDGQFLVGPDGTILLGIYGSVQVAGLTRDQARERVREFISGLTGDRPDRLQVYLDVIAFNSKTYFVISDGAGYGEQVQEFPVTGNDTVLSAVARIGGLPPVSSKRHIWVARRSPHGGHDQILPVDWVGLTQQGVTATNYQVLPGDRVYIQSQAIITADNWLAKFLSPVERIFGITLLGASTVRTIDGSQFSGGNQ